MVSSFRFKGSEQHYLELRLLGRQYRQYMKFRVENVLAQQISGSDDAWHKDFAMRWNKYTGKDKLADFAYEYWHYDNIAKKSENSF